MPTTRFVDTEAELVDAVEAIAKCEEVAFDSEGVDLSRHGPLTVAIISGTSSGDTVYVVDVQKLGGERVFSETRPSFRAVLQHPNITKVTFDCRGDSDALFHQFGVKLCGVLDLQVLDQGVRIQTGEAPPARSDYVNLPTVQGMNKIAERYGVTTVKGSVSHKRWGKRPLPKKEIKYAAKDVVIIKELLTAMRETATISRKLVEAVREHSERYASFLRDRKVAIHRQRDRDIVLEEHPIITQEELPPDHSRRKPYAVERWEKALKPLQAREESATVYNDVMFIFQHSKWYTAKAFERLALLAPEYPHFTENQSHRIMSSLGLSSDSEGEDFSFDSDEDVYYSGDEFYYY